MGAGGGGNIPLGNSRSPWNCHHPPPPSSLVGGLFYPLLVLYPYNPPPKPPTIKAANPTMYRLILELEVSLGTSAFHGNSIPPICHLNISLSFAISFSAPAIRCDCGYQYCTLSPFWMSNYPVLQYSHSLSMQWHKQCHH